MAGLVPRLLQWLSRQPRRRDVLVVGGGRIADHVRDCQRMHGLNDLAAHWLAIDGMATHARLLASLLPGLSEPRAVAEIQACSPPFAVLEPMRFMRDEEPNFPPPCLPVGWMVTSDSIAARLAQVLGAAELVLLKSRLPPLPVTAAAAAHVGYVDEYFPQAIPADCRVRYVNFRDPNFAEVWQQDG